MNNALYKFQGELLAVSPLAVNRPGDNFVSARGSEHLRRLPRSGIKQDNAPVYFPATTIRRLLRESARNVVRDAMQRLRPEAPFSLSTHMMLSSGVDIGNRVLHENAVGRIGGENVLREKNPLLSLFGRWKLAGHLHVGNAVPDDNSCVYVEGNGARQNDFERDPALIETLAKDDVDTLRALIARDRNAARDADAIKADALRRPLEGFEAIRAGTALRHSMRLDRATPIELGLLLASLREAARHPLVGGHRNLGCGEIRGEYDVLMWGIEQERPSSIGSVAFGFDGFVAEGKLLQDALQHWDKCAREIFDRFDFERYLMESEDD